MKYDYKCESCNSIQELTRSIHEDPVAPVCVDCNQSMVRIYTAPPVKFNATGFYSTGG